MKLYAKIKSERGKEVSKSGNEYIKIDLYNDKRLCFSTVEILPDEKIIVKKIG